MYSSGIDMIEVHRIEKLLVKSSGVIKRLFTEEEICSLGDLPFSFAQTVWVSRFFAMKEAVMKVCGMGWQDGVAWQDIELKKSEFPQVVNLRGKLKEFANAKKIKKIVAVSCCDKKLALSQALALS